MRSIALSLLFLGLGCARPKMSDTDPPSGASGSIPVIVPVKAGTIPMRPRVIGSVCVLGCGGPLPVDDKGNVYASVHLSIETTQPTIRVELASLELREASGVRVAVMVSAGTLVMGRGPFDGTVPEGGTVRLWSSARLDASLIVLTKSIPTDFVGEVVVSGVRVEIKGTIPPPGTTG